MGADQAGPAQGMQTSPHSPLWYFTTVGEPSAVIYYTFDAKEVLLVSIQRRP